MNGTLDRFIVAGLHGKKTIDATLHENTLVLVGENGSGKTTFLRILFHFLSGRWFALRQFKFDHITATFGGRNVKLSFDSLTKGFEKIDQRYLAGMPPNVRRRFMDWVSAHGVAEMPPDLERWLHRSGIPWEVVVNQLQLFEDNPRGPRKELQESIQFVRDTINSQILYLPTYRRIERELESIFEGIDVDDVRRGRAKLRTGESENTFIELVEFGMRDVQQAIENALSGLRDFARENLTTLTFRNLGDVVNKEYLKVGMKEISEVSDDTIRSVLDRVPESILTSLHKEHLLKVVNIARTTESPDDHSKIICNYFLNLLHFQTTLQERERPISAFCDLCSQYTTDKQFVYDSAQFGFTIVPKDEKFKDHKIELGDPSSGEKQIVSLFNHLYLSGKHRYFVLIDEPELSLSVPWQRRFLMDIRKGGFCAGLVAVTHSPFIYDNELKPFAHSLGEFVTI
jgi:predicted ATP-dependent endonuclease of OLD family